MYHYLHPTGLKQRKFGALAGNMNSKHAIVIPTHASVTYLEI